jgi:hypothetical protein
MQTEQTDTTLTSEQRAALDRAREAALDASADLSDLAEALLELALGRGSVHDVRMVRGFIDGAGALGVSRVADWEALIRGREVGA